MLIYKKNSCLDQDSNLGCSLYPLAHWHTGALPIVPPRRITGSSQNLSLSWSPLPSRLALVPSVYNGEHLCWHYFNWGGLMLTTHRGILLLNYCRSAACKLQVFKSFDWLRISLIYSSYLTDIWIWYKVYQTRINKIWEKKVWHQPWKDFSTL